MIWVENTTRRFKRGYNYFGRYPEKFLSFFDRHMKAAERGTLAAGRCEAGIAILGSSQGLTVCGHRPHQQAGR